MKQSFVALILAGAFGLVTGCGPQPDLTGFYQTPVDATTSRGQHWYGTADVFLTQVGHSLNGQLILYHPKAGAVHIPITSGSATDGTVLFCGHGQLPLGNVDVSFRGKQTGSRIEGAVQVTVQSLFGGQDR